ncbi:MAG: hypothetical protein A2020_14425 [Lentisphaerae bacterium GWF2_45_14]|nr:MAG: hypothetical protein A2020_14425 [Lentisphaerae bacterium GWF2_45_14]
MQINLEEYVEELIYTVNRKDPIKARVLLNYFDKLDDKTRARVIEELGSGDNEYSIPLLSMIASDYYHLCPDIKKLKAILISKFLISPERLAEALQNHKTMQNKKFFIDIAGELHCEKALQSIINILNMNTDRETIIATLNAFGNIGSSEAVNIITDHLYSNNREIILAAVKALRKIATPGALSRLSERMGTDTQLDLLIIDVFAQVQDSVSLEKLNETLVSHSAIIRNYGKTKMINIGEKSVPILISNLTQDDPDLLIHTLNALGSIGDKSAINPIRKLLFNEPKNPNVRFAAYEALGMLPLEKESYVLAGGLADPVENVRMAAAKAINHNYTQILAAGIRNLLKNKENDPFDIIRVVIDSESDNIFLDLINDEPIKKLALAYLKNKAHHDVTRHFSKLLIKHSHKAMASKIQKTAEKKNSGKKVFVVDDSRMILNVYRTTLHSLGFDPCLFEFPSSLLEAIEKEKPDLLITDLNMPELTGIDVALKVREKFNNEELPIIMVTTQNETKDNESAYQAGIDDIMQKPFDEKSLGEAIKKVFHGENKEMP